MEEIIKRLSRYSAQCIAERLDPDFAEAVIDAIVILETRKAMEKLTDTNVGKWIPKDGYDGDIYWDCSNCGESWTTLEGEPFDNGMNYCPNCGARMDGE